MIRSFLEKTHNLIRSFFKGRRCIRNVIIVYFLTTIVAFLTLLGSTLYIFNKRHLEEEMGKRLIAIASLTIADIPAWQLTRFSSENRKPRTYLNLQKKLEHGIDTGQVSRAYIFDLENKSIVDTDSRVTIGSHYYDHALYPKEITKARSGIPVHTHLFKGNDGIFYKKAFVPIVRDGKVIAIIGLQASADFFHSLVRMRRYIFYSVVLMSLLIIILSIFISDKIVRPISQLVGAAKRIGMGDLETPVTMQANNEFGDLGASIDEMRADLRENNYRLQAMLQGIAHEIRNPLGGIELFSGLLKEELGKRDKEKKQYVQNIESEVEHLKKIIDQFLDFARETTPEKGWYVAEDFFASINIAVQLMSQKALIELKFEVDPGLENLWLDEPLMRRVLVNLVRNSIQSIQSDGGKVEVLAKVDHQVDRRGFTIQVRDNGEGISEDQLENVFRPFYTTKEKGCGLGLSFCQKIVHAHGGQMRIDSAPGQGTTMTLWLPFDEHASRTSYPGKFADKSMMARG